MNAILNDSVWLRRGISVLWDNKELIELLSRGRTISLREFFCFYEQKWPEDQIPFIDGDTLLVTGLDAALDTLDAKEAEEWSIKEVSKRIYAFQSWASTGYALVFWMSDEKRWKKNLDEDRYTWRCDGKDRGEKIELGQGIWGGAQSDVRRIEIKGRPIGLYQDRIS